MQKLRVFSWNVNSINARMENVLRLIEQYKPDILLLQETKCETGKFPKEPFEDIGYNVVMSGQKSYNGVAILSLHRFHDVLIKSFVEGDNEARYIEAMITANNRCFRVASVYVPNGQSLDSEKFQKKLVFIDHLRKYLEQLDDEETFIIGGDFNIAQEPIDLYDPVKFANCVGFHDIERKQIKAILSGKLKDTLRHIYPDCKIFSWWDYRDKFAFTSDRGWRIDYILCSNVDLLHSSGIVRHTRTWTRPSDHAPVFCELKI
jgi:exodeoxyribonuclease-3